MPSSTSNIMGRPGGTKWLTRGGYSAAQTAGNAASYLGWQPGFLKRPFSLYHLAFEASCLGLSNISPHGLGPFQRSEAHRLRRTYCLDLHAARREMRVLQLASVQFTRSDAGAGCAVALTHGSKICMERVLMIG